MTIHAGCDLGLLARVLPVFDLPMPLAEGRRVFVGTLVRPAKQSDDLPMRVIFGEPNPVTLLFPELKPCPSN